MTAPDSFRGRSRARMFWSGLATTSIRQKEPPAAFLVPLYGVWEVTHRPAPATCAFARWLPTR